MLYIQSQALYLNLAGTKADKKCSGTMIPPEKMVPKDGYKAILKHFEMDPKLQNVWLL